MKPIYIIIGALALLICGCTNLKSYTFDVMPEQLESYTVRSLDIYNNPSNWLESGAGVIEEYKCTRVPNTKPWFMMSGHCGGTLGDDPYITVNIPVRTPNSDQYDGEFVAMTFHHPTEALKFVGFWFRSK